MARRCWCLAAALLCLYAGAAAAESARAGCISDIAGYSQFLGLKKAGAKFVDYAPLAKNGHIKQISLYFNKASGCVRGAKAAFGPLPTPGMIGSSANTTEVALKLKDGEHVTKAEFKAKQCIGYLKLSTNTGRSISVGSASAPGSMAQSAANKTGGHLVALRGFQSTADGKPGPLQQLQFVWGTSQCPSTAELLMMETGSLTVDQPGRAAVNAVNDDPSVCAPKPEMCNEKASMNSFSYCVWNAPFGRPSCKGGCCFSSGKCASSSCAISGVGRDVANMICYGTNAGFGFGGSNLCAGLACKLAVPGCTTDAFGGNCVGTVVAFGDKSTLNPASQKYIGAPCLDATPSDTTLDEQGNPAGISGVYMGKLWTICDCAGNPGMLETPAHMLVNLTATSIGNLTKNDVLLAISQVLPKVNLSEALNATRTTELFPSFTEMFKMPEMPSIQLPSFLTHGSNSSDESIQIKLPDLGQLLGRFTGFSRTFSAVDQIVSTPGMLPPYDPAAEAAAQAAAAAAAELAAAEAAAAAAPAAEQAAAAAPTAA
ncbi:hypothetical protein OEZ86_007459 [Tetradesmus obliquus]|nr:hypothetical protein OEZ86_007459 [Tetradesmus obliquus]